MSFLENNFFLLAVTFGVFFFAKLLQKKTGLVLLNPILLTIAVLIIFLKMANISYETYNQGGHLIEFWLRPVFAADVHGSGSADSVGGCSHRKPLGYRTAYVHDFHCLKSADGSQ